MRTVLAQIKLYSPETGRTTPVKSGYRPHFLFEGGERTSGSIELVHKDQLLPGGEAVVSITFVLPELLGKAFNVGSAFIFYEALHPIGEGRVLEILD